MKPKTYCEKWPVGCQSCDLTLCDAKKDTHEMTLISNVEIPGEIVSFEYEHRCVPCKPTQPECGECEFSKHITNADRIRAMTDEELAEILHNAGGNWYSEEYWFNWLNKESDAEVV